MKNWAMDWTDKRLKELEERIAEAYKTAEKEITAKMQAYLDRFAKQDAVMLAKYKNGEITKAELTEWRTNHFMMGKNWQAVKDSIAGDILKTDAISAGIVNNALIDVYTQNANYAYYELEQGTGTGLSFNLYDRNAVENLLKDNPDFMPHYEPKTPIVERWNKQHITSEMLQGIMQGESIPHIAKRMQTVVGMEKNSAIRNARTYTTSVENKAKMDRYEEAEDMGIDLEKEWMATLDERTRESHRELDGERVANDEPFSNGLMYPADPSGDPAEVYNCRCRIVPRIKGRQYDRSGRANKLGDMSYEDWKKGKEKEQANDVKGAEKTASPVENMQKAIFDAYDYHVSHNGLHASSADELGADWFKVTLTEMDDELKESISNQFANLAGKYDTTIQEIRPMNKMEYVAGKDSFATTFHNYETDSSTIIYNPAKIKDTERVKELVNNGFATDINEEFVDKYVITHEFAHTLIDMGSELNNKRNWVEADYTRIKNIRGEINALYNRYAENIGALGKLQKETELKALTTLNEEDWKKAGELAEEIKEKSLGKYSLTNSDEFMAECFTHYELGGKQNDYVDEMMGIINKYFKR